MQREEVKQLVMAILSGYLAYIGFGLVRVQEAPRSAVYIVAGIIFMLFGAASFVWYVRRFILMRRERSGKDDENAEGEEHDAQS